jgi:hypothetical protein
LEIEMRWTAAIGALAFLLTFEVTAVAQDGIPLEGFSANRFTPVPGADNYITVDGAQVAGELVPSAGLYVDYAHRPFVLFDADCDGNDTDDCVLGDSERELVSYVLGFNAMGSLTFLDRFQVGLLLPFAYTEGESFNAMVGETDLNVPGGSAFGMGDLRFNGKVRVFGEGSEGVFLAAIVYGTAPLGEATAENRYLGHDGFTGGINAAAEFRYERVRFGYNLGGAFRGSKQVLSTEVGPELTYGAGLAVVATSILDVLAELQGASAFTSQVDENPLELRIAGRLRQGDFLITAGGGLGLISGVGVPNFRALAGFGWQPQGLDSDYDGIREDDDACPTEPEDLDGYLDEDGCPDEDNDGDGVLDDVDQCPDEQEDPDGYLDEDGCPDTDNDKDGIPDGYDSCPNEPEDKDGDRDDDGCPDFDTDRDGIPDKDDKCPNEPEDTDGFGDDDGCPEIDFDGDGINDDEDECPEEAEDKDGFEDLDGCPEEGEGEGDASSRPMSR